MKKKLQIFVSSTYLDLLKERQSAVEAILRSKHIPAGMELFSAGNKSQLDTIKQWIQESDIYMLILGGRYGSIENESGLSYTEIEYRYAIELDKPIFAVVLDESMLDKKVKDEGKTVLELENPEKFKKFKKLALSKVCRLVKDVTEIKLSIFESIIDITNDYELSGWIRGDEIPRNTDFLDEINILRNQRDELQEKVISLESLNKKAKKNNDSIGDYSFNDVSKALSSKKITLPASINAGNELNTNVLRLLLHYKSYFVTGVSSNMTGDIYRFIMRALVPILLNFNLVDRVSVRSRSFPYEKFVISSLGNKFLSIVEIQRAEKSEKKLQQTTKPKPHKGLKDLL